MTSNPIRLVTVTIKAHDVSGMSGHGRGCPMSNTETNTDQFWEYAKEAMLLACDAKIAKDKQDLLELSGTWTQAALQSRSRQLGEVSAA